MLDDVDISAVPLWQRQHAAAAAADGDDDAHLLMSSLSLSRCVVVTLTRSRLYVNTSNRQPINNKPTSLHTP